MKNNLLALTFGLISILLIYILCDITPTFQIVLHGFIDTFAAGRSSIKVILFLLYLFTLICLWVSHQRGVTTKLNIDLSRLFILLGTGFLAGISLHFFFYSLNHIPFLSYAITFSEADLSTTSILHNHLPKAGFGLLESFLGSSSRFLDAGGAYIGYIPLSFSLLFLILVPTLITYFLRVFISLKKSKNILWVFAYAVITFSLFKNVFDGGLFNYEVLPAFVAFFILIRSNLSERVIKRILLIGGAYVIALLSLLLASTDGQVSYLSRMGICFISLCSILTLVEVSYKKIRSYFLIFAVLGLIYAVYIRSSDMIAYERTPIEEDGAIVGVYNDKGLTFLLIRESGSIKTVGDVIERYNLVNNHIPVAVPWQTCIPRAPWNKESFKLVSKDTPRATTLTKHLYSLELSTLTKFPDEQTLYQGTLTTDPCTPLHLNILESSLKDLGLQNSIIYSE